MFKFWSIIEVNVAPILLQNYVYENPNFCFADKSMSKITYQKQVFLHINICMFKGFLVKH